MNNFTRQNNIELRAFPIKLPREARLVMAEEPGVGVMLQSMLSVTLRQVEGNILCSGADAAVAADALRELLGKHLNLEGVDTRAVMNVIAMYQPKGAGTQPAQPNPDADRLHIHEKVIVAKTAGQGAYVRALTVNTINFGIGPAGSGKTYLAVAHECSALINGDVQKIILTRPAVEAGEKLGFLLGDLKEKIDPYMQPLYDALNECLGAKRVSKMIEEKIIEICPFAYMRGRTLKNAQIIVDEAQNTTVMQMKMVLTRLGEGSRMTIVGDVSQNDLPRGVESGLNSAVGISGIGISEMTAEDIVRHPLVAKIVTAYAKAETRTN